MPFSEGSVPSHTRAELDMVRLVASWCRYLLSGLGALLLHRLSAVPGTRAGGEREKKREKLRKMNQMIKE